MSQRLLVFLIEIVKIVVIAIAAYTTGKGVRVGNDLTATLLLLAVPITLVAGTVLAFFETLEARIADETLKPNDFVGMLALASFWIMQVANLSAELSLFGFAIIPPESQVVIVTMFQSLAAVVIWSFGQRVPGDAVKSKERAVQAQYAKRREADQLEAEYPPGH